MFHSNLIRMHRTAVLVLEVFLLVYSSQASGSKWKGMASSLSVSASPGATLPLGWPVSIANPNGSSSQPSSLAETLFGSISVLQGKQNNTINDVKSLTTIPKGNVNDKLSNVKTDREGYTNGYNNEYPNGYINAYDHYDNKKAFHEFNVLEQALPNVVSTMTHSSLSSTMSSSPLLLPPLSPPSPPPSPFILTETVPVPIEKVQQLDRVVPVSMHIERKVPQPILVDRFLPIRLIHPVPEPVVQSVTVDRPLIIERKIPVPEPLVLVARPVKVPFVPPSVRIEQSNLPVVPLRARFFTSPMCAHRPFRHSPFFRNILF